MVKPIGTSLAAANLENLAEENSQEWNKVRELTFRKNFIGLGITDALYSYKGLFSRECNRFNSVETSSLQLFHINCANTMLLYENMKTMIIIISFNPFL